MKKHSEIPSTKGLYWYFENGKDQPEPVLVDHDRYVNCFKGFNGRQQSWLREGEYLEGPQLAMTADRLEFEDDAHSIEVDGQKMVGVWTDGVMLSSDNGKSKMMPGIAPCAMNLKVGKKYRVTVEEIK